MANVTIYKLQVLAHPADLQQISESLGRPSSELLNSATDNPSEQVIEGIRKLVAFEQTDEEGIREFTNRVKHGSGLVLDHLADVSKQFPNAVFLLEYLDDQMNYSAKAVINSGKQTHQFYDAYQHAQTVTWVLPDIFIPFRIEHEHKLKFGSLWQEWLDDMETAIEILKHDAKQETAEAERLRDGLMARNAAFHNANLTRFLA